MRDGENRPRLPHKVTDEDLVRVGSKPRNRWLLYALATVLLAACAFTAGGYTFYDKGKRDQVAQIEAEASASAAAQPPADLACPQSTSDDAKTKAIRDKQRIVIGEPTTGVLAVRGGVSVFVRAAVTGDIIVCGDNALLVIEVKLPDSARVLMGGGGTKIALVDGVPQPQQVWFSNKHPVYWKCYVKNKPSGDVPRACSSYYLSPEVASELPTPSPTPKSSPIKK